jgi:hypothetical protein
LLFSISESFKTGVRKRRLMEDQLHMLIQALIKQGRITNLTKSITNKMERYRIAGYPSGEGCLEKADDLCWQYAAVLFWVGSITGVTYHPEDFIGHQYVIPLNAKPTSKALNQSDNGFGQYPPFTIEEIFFIHDRCRNE